MICNNAIIFSNRKRDVAVLTKSLEKHGFSVGCLHGDMDQRARMTSLDAFRNGGVSLLVCSDVAARGLDIPAVSHVFNFDVPTHAEDYVHRIGRTGRAGRTGTAISIVTRSDQKYVDEIEKLIQRKIDWFGEDLGSISEDEGGAEAVAGQATRATLFAPARPAWRHRRAQWCQRTAARRGTGQSRPAAQGAGVFTVRPSLGARASSGRAWSGTVALRRARDGRQSAEQAAPRRRRRGCRRLGRPRAVFPASSGQDQAARHLGFRQRRTVPDTSGRRSLRSRLLFIA